MGQLELAGKRAVRQVGTLAGKRARRVHETPLPSVHPALPLAAALPSRLPAVAAVRHHQALAHQHRRHSGGAVVLLLPAVQLAVLLICLLLRKRGGTVLVRHPAGGANLSWFRHRSSIVQHR